MRTSVLVPLLLLFFPVLSEAKRSFSLDTAARAAQPLCFRGYRIITPAYFDPETPYYFIGKARGAQPDEPLASQIIGLLAANAGARPGIEDTLTISIHDFKFYDIMASGEIISLFLHADFFIGPRGALRHLYSLDTLYQKRQSRNSSPRFVSDCLLEAASTACRHRIRPGERMLTDREADAYYQDALMSFPLYSATDLPVGLFRTVNDFINLTVVDTPVVFEHEASIEGDGYNTFYFRQPDGSKGRRVSPKGYFGGCDGKNFWISTWDGYRKIRKSNGGYFLTISSEMLARQDRNYMNGALGYLLSVAADEAMGGAEAPGA